MKKISTTIISLAASKIVFAQDSAPNAPSIPQLSSDDSSSIESIINILPIVLFVFLLLQVIKYILSHKLKNKIIDRGISEQLANSILEKSEGDKKDDSIKWALLLLGLSAGLMVSYYTMPLNIHSLAIMTFSLGLSYLAYFFYLRR